MAGIEERVRSVRDFNRFWSHRVGLLRAGLLATRFSLTEARVIFELAQREETEAGELRARLGLDAGYLSRIIARLRDEKIAVTDRSPQDARRQVVRLTDLGRDVFADLDARSAAQVRSMLADLSAEDRQRLVSSMRTIREVFDPPSLASGPYVIRGLRAGDLGWVVHRHGVLYAQEYGWDETFEALVARIVAEYVERHDRRRDSAWIAEVDGRQAGSVFCMAKDDETARLRLLLVEPWARGHGIGTRLVDECVRFATQACYQRLELWTNDVLHAARKLYEAAGFQLENEEGHHSFGHDLVGQYWSLALRGDE